MYSFGLGLEKGEKSFYITYPSKSNFSDFYVFTLLQELQLLLWCVCDFATQLWVHGTV